MSVRNGKGFVECLRSVAAIAAAVSIIVGLPALEGSGAFAAPKKPSTYQVEVLASDGAVDAPHVDPNLKNAIGLARSATGPWLVSNNATSLATSYDGDGAPQSLVITVPGSPTGVAFNSSSSFIVTDGAYSAPAEFLFASNDGTISGYSSNVPPSSTAAHVMIDRSPQGAVYKGLTTATTISGDRLYAADFRNGRVDVFDSSLSLVSTSSWFVDSRIPAGYAPFGIQNLNGRIIVTYAKQDATATSAVAGSGQGFVDMFDTSGILLARLAARGQLNAPYGLAIAPAGFGESSANLLVSNAGDGTIATFDLTSDMMKATPSGLLRGADNKSIRIDGLGAIGFGNGSQAGPTNQLYFAAGPDSATHGVFGKVVVLSGI